MNYFVAIWCLVSLTVTVNADGLGVGGLVYAPKHASLDYYAYPRYAFEYAVKDPHTGDNKAQWEKREGDVVRGAYSLVEPDGNLRIVEYWADDKSGFNAVVKRVGPNLHPAVVPAPIYKAPIPVIGSAGYAPLSIGPVAKLGGLASAPLITGPLGLSGGAVSTANLYKAAPIVKVAAPIAPVAPILPAPIIKPAPIINPIGIAPPLYPAPVLKSPYIGSHVWGPIPAPILPAPAPIIKSPIGLPAVSLGEGLLSNSYGGYNNYVGLAKGPILPPYGGYWDSSLGWKH